MSALIRGELMHARRDELARRTFRYPVMMAAIELAELPALDRRLRLFSHNRPNLFALYDRDYERGAIGDLRAANGVPAPQRTRLITNLRTCGYVFNPVSFFLGYDAAGALSSVIAEVNNTYGGRRRYVLGPAQRLADRGGRVGFRTVRELYVSPFLHGECDYEWWFDAPLDSERVAITMHVDRQDGDRIFVAQLTGRCEPFTDRALLAAAVRYPAMSAQVIALIHLEAMKLRLRGVPFLGPAADHRPHPRPPRWRGQPRMQ